MSEAQPTVDHIFTPGYWDVPGDAVDQRPFPLNGVPKYDLSRLAFKVFQEHVTTALDQWKGQELPQMTGAFRAGSLAVGTMIFYDIERLFETYEPSNSHPGHVSDPDYPVHARYQLNRLPQDLALSPSNGLKVEGPTHWLPVGKAIITNNLDVPEHREYVRESGVGQIVTVGGHHVFRTPAYFYSNYDKKDASTVTPKWLRRGPMADGEIGTTHKIKPVLSSRILERIISLWLYEPSAEDLAERLKKTKSDGWFGKVGRSFAKARGIHPAEDLV